jgi:uncharacterized damage-inducible protein DinB
MERDAALSDFAAARQEWEEAFARVPDEALRYLKPGDDYSLGGLQVHVNWVLAHYLRVLEGQVVVNDPPLSDDARLGLTTAKRRTSLVEMARLHTAVLNAALRRPESAWQQTTPVIYGEGQDPYPTSPDNVIEWLRDHYREHVAQCADLIAEWRTATKAAG